ncbi:hypothetical protein TNCV_5066641 [Trichonephila clavipes]|nr:hypothetical protein TNCV_5066641 [Trichonephila clavipes]
MSFGRGKILTSLTCIILPIKSLPDNLFDISESNLLVGDLNAKHSSWGSVINNKRGVELHNLMDDSAHLGDGSPTYSSHSYHTEEALDVSIVSSDIFPFCKSFTGH